jgi:putative FmdB family regulatory protein
MPTYDYECKDCGYTFEKFQSMSEDALTTCPECHKDELRRLVGGGMGVIFKGSGFYVNDTKSKSSAAGPVKKEANSSGGNGCAGCSAASS